MIGRLRGLIVEKGHDSILLEVGGVGYVISITPRTLSELPGLAQEAVLYTHLHVREDQLSLFGFESAPETELFRLLLGISGVGPKVALAILATMTPDQLRIAVTTEDLAALTSVPGIGKRSAQKLLLELRPKLDVLDAPTVSTGPIGEVRGALEGLGYSAEEIRGTLSGMPSDLPVEEMMKRSLQYLGKAGP